MKDRPPVLDRKPERKAPKLTDAQRKARALDLLRRARQAGDEREKERKP